MEDVGFLCLLSLGFFFFNDTATTEIYTLSLHDALPISGSWCYRCCNPRGPKRVAARSEEHTSELQSRQYIVCRLLLEKKKRTTARHLRTTTKRPITHTTNPCAPY